jgi:hypothetical protein
VKATKAKKAQKEIAIEEKEDSLFSATKPSDRSLDIPPEAASTVLDAVSLELLKKIKPRSRDILIKRFGLEGGEGKVLDKIGQEFKITRERVRQIEQDSFKKLRKAKKSEDFENIISRALEIIDSAGGFCEKKFLKERLKKNLSQKDRNQLMFILNSSDKLGYKKDNLKISGFWYNVEDQGLELQVVKAHNFVLDHIKSSKKSHYPEEVSGYLSTTQWKEFFSGERGRKRLEMILRLSNVIENNILGEWGIRSWRNISQRGSREKAYLVLKKYGKPLHFKEITDLINQHWDNKEALPQTVHNELIKDKRFILIGRGTYGLVDWNFSGKTVRELIKDFLKKHVQASQEAVVDFVLSRKKVKRSTVLVALSDKENFKKNKDGSFMIRC